jgi:predicted MFS family arabinose efflux permease
MLAVLRQKNFARLWAGGAISMLGDWLLFIALPFAIYNLTGSALATGAMFIAQSLPTLLFGALGGVFADRWDRRRTMIVADLLRAALLLLLLVVHSAEMLWALYLVVFLEASVAQFFNPAKNALLPRLVDEQQLMPANALNWMSIELTRLVGAPLGGVLVALWGLESVVLLDSVSYLLSAMLIALVAAPPAERAAAAAPADAPSPLAAVWRDLAEGLRLVARERWLAGLFLAMGVLMVGQGITNALLVPFINQVLHGDAQIFGWVVTAQGVGGLIGGLLIGRIGKLFSPTWIMSVSAWLLGAIVLVIVNIPWLPLVLGLIALVGIPVVAFVVTESTLLQTGVADQYRGRIFGAYGTTQALTLLIGMGLASALGDRVGVVPLLDLVGGLYVLCGLIILAMVGRRPAATESAALSGEVGV